MRILGILVGVLAAVPLGAQPSPGSYLVADQNGTIWEVSRAGVTTTFLKLGRDVWGLDFDVRGNLLATGTGILWRIDPRGTVKTLFDGIHVYPIGDIAVNPAGNCYISALGNNFIIEVDPGGRVVSAFALTGAPHAWGLGLDPQGGRLYAAAAAAIYAYDPARKTLTTLYAGLPLQFCQGGAFGPGRRFFFTDEIGREFFAIDARGQLTTLLRGGPLVDPGEGVTVDATGDLVFTDDGANAGPTRNRIYRLTPGSPAVLSTVAATGPFGDVNGIAAVPGLFVTPAHPTVSPGRRAVLAVSSVHAAMEPYAFGSALSANTGVPLPGGRRFPLDPDDLLVATAGNLLPALFRSYQGRLDGAGQAALAIQVPNVSRLVGVKIYTAGLTFHPRAPGHIHLVSNVARTEIVK